MADRVISEELLSMVINYIATGSVPKQMVFAELNIILNQLQELPSAVESESAKEFVARKQQEYRNGEADVSDG